MLYPLSMLLAAATPTATAAALDTDLAAQAIVLRAHAEGAQIYECKVGQGGGLAWTFREPIASLSVDGKTIGRHYAGPHWALDDGSLIQGKMISTVPGETPADVPLLKLAVTSNGGQGALGSVTLVYRMATHGGTLRGSCASAGALRSVAYSADYVFAK